MRFHELSLILVAIFFMNGCNGSGSDPVSPDSNSVNQQFTKHVDDVPSTQLWGFYDVAVDIENKSAVVNINRNAMFSMNIVHFLNKNPATLGIDVNTVTVTAEYIDIDFDVSLTHPFPSAPHLNCYDVRGVFIGDEGTYAFTDFCLAGYPHFPPSEYQMDKPGFPGSQEMMDDPKGGDGGGPDGYTRWFSPKKFKNEGLFGYTQGEHADDIYSKTDYYHSADLNPYKLFADGLGSHDDLMDWLEANPDTTRVFSSGATNTRNYYVRFPNTGVQFAYALIANWESETEHPSNMREAVACEKIYGTVHPDYHVYEFKIYDPLSDVNPDTGEMDDYVVHLIEVSDYGSGGTIMESWQLVPIEIGENYCVYHHEILSDYMQIYGTYDFWVIPRYDGYDYSNPYGVPNGLGSEELAAWFCFELDYSDENWE